MNLTEIDDIIAKVTGIAPPSSIPPSSMKNGGPPSAGGSGPPVPPPVPPPSSMKSGAAPVPRPFAPVPPPMAPAVVTLREEPPAPLGPPLTHTTPCEPAAPVAAAPVAAPVAAAVATALAPVSTSSTLEFPTFTTDEMAQEVDLRNFAMVATLRTKRWHATTRDRIAARDIAEANDADDKAFKVEKNLLAGADEKLKAIYRAIDDARGRHYELTTPWSTTGLSDDGKRKGDRILANTLFFEYTETMAKALATMKAALAEFVPLYPELVEKAREKLGKRFNAAEYPDPSMIEREFDLSFDFYPVPQGTDFAGLPEQQLTRLAAAMNKKTRIMMENAMQDVWARLYQTVSHMHACLADPNKKFHHTLVGNVREAARLAGHLNVTHDSRVEALRVEIERELCQHEATVLRENPTLRAKIAAAAGAVVAQMDRMSKENRK